MKIETIIKYNHTIERIVNNGFDITNEIDGLINLMQGNLESSEVFLNNINYRTKTLSPGAIFYISNLTQQTINKIENFENELEEISGYTKEEDVFYIDDSILSILRMSSTINVNMRISLEEYIDNLEMVRDIIEDIVTNLNMQRTGPFKASDLIM